MSSTRVVTALRKVAGAVPLSGLLKKQVSFSCFNAPVDSTTTAQERYKEVIDTVQCGTRQNPRYLHHTPRRLDLRFVCMI